MEFGIFKIFQVFGIVSAWASKAFEDGKVTLVEAVSLVTQLAGILGIPTELDIPGSEPTEEEVSLKTSIDPPDTSEDTDLNIAARPPPK